jgi:flagellar protein FliO/FliZ
MNAVRPRRPGAWLAVGSGVWLAAPWLTAPLSAAVWAAVFCAIPGRALAAEAAAGAAAGLTQAGLGLFAVIALILGLAWLARRVGLVRQGTPGAAIKVVSSTMLGARQRLVLVEVEDTWLVLGVSAGEIRPLHTMPARSAGRPDAGDGGIPPTPPGGTFAQKLLRSMQDNLKS